MPNQPAGWPITGTTATKPPSEEPKDDHPIEQTLQKRCRGTWQSSQSIQIPSFTKNRMSCCSYISYYFLSININCLSFTWISMAFVTCISGKKFSKSCTFHPSSSKYQNCLNSAKLLVFFKHLQIPRKKFPVVKHPPSLSNFGFGSFGPWGKGSWARKQNLRGGLKGFPNGNSGSKWKN